MNLAGLAVPVCPDVDTVSAFKLGRAANGLMAGAINEDVNDMATRTTD